MKNLRGKPPPNRLESFEACPRNTLGAVCDTLGAPTLVGGPLQRRPPVRRQAGPVRGGFLSCPSGAPR